MDTHVKVLAALYIVFGILGALYVDSIIGFVEMVFLVKFMPQDVYQIADLPSQLQAGDVVFVSVDPASARSPVG